MKKLLFVLPLIALVGFWQACKKDDTTQNPSGITVTVDFRGSVTDIDGEPIVGATIRIGGSLTETDANGVFVLRNQKVNSQHALVTASKAGYHNGSRLLTANEGDQKIVQIMLFEKYEVGTFQGISGGNIVVPGGAIIKFPASGIKVDGGNAYGGKVSVSAVYLNPEDPDLGRKMPGDLRGIRTGGEEQALASFGMMVVELTGAQGQKLQIADGSEAEITMPMPANMVAGAPATIPLWHFDESQGLWVEEGFATKVGNSYVGKVNHFSFWNCDDPYNLIFLEGRLLINGNPAPGLTVRLTLLSTGVAGFGITDQNGYFSGSVPANEVMEIEVLDPCGSVVHSETVGPFSSNTVLPAITLQATGSNFLEVTATLVDCAGAPVSNGYIRFSGTTLNNVLFTDVNGAVSGTIFLCSSTASTYTAFDLSVGKQSATATLTIPPTQHTLGTLTVCNNLDEFITYILDGGQAVNMVGGNAGLDGNYFHVSNSSNPGSTNFSMRTYMPTPGVGAYAATNYFSVGNVTAADSLPVNQNIFIAHNITQWGAVGQQVVGDFNGTFVDWSGMNHTISGHYQLTRGN